MEKIKRCGQGEKENSISSIEERQENNQDNKNKESSKNGLRESSGKGRQAKRIIFLLLGIPEEFLKTRDCNSFTLKGEENRR